MNLKADPAFVAPNFRVRAILSKGMKWVVMGLVCASVASCSTTSHKRSVSKRQSKEYFAESEYGVKASPRVHSGGNVPKGGGRFQIGKPYRVKGKVYVPKEDVKYNKVGLASWYGSAFHGRLTANGEVYDQHGISAAHPTFPLPSYARVTNVANGTSVIVRVNDRGPYHPGRIVDLSDKAADLLDMKHSGTAKVRVQYVGRARMDGHDMPYLMASYVAKGGRPKPQQQIPTDGMPADVMIASSQTTPDQTSIGVTDPSTTASAATALDRTNASVSFESFDAVGEYAQLPVLGPMPLDRPAMMVSTAGQGISALAAYTRQQVEQAATPFSLILPPKQRLNAKSSSKK